MRRCDGRLWELIRQRVKRSVYHCNRAKGFICPNGKPMSLDVGGSHIEVVGIDEIQLFPASIITVIEELVKSEHIVIGAGLALLADGRSFGSMPELLARADVITQVYGVCAECGNPAVRCWPKFNKTEDVVLGNDYIALCRRCWYKKQEEEEYVN